MIGVRGNQTCRILPAALGVVSVGAELVDARVILYYCVTLICLGFVV
jgi:hypothetical protein